MKSNTLLVSCDKRIVIKSANSRTLLFLVSSAHLAALLLLYCVDLHLSLLLIIAGLIVFNLYLYISTEMLNTHRLSLQRGGPLMLQKHPQCRWEDVMITESFLSGWVIALKLKSLIDAKRYTVVYAADAINPLSYRQLVIYLKQHHY